MNNKEYELSNVSFTNKDFFDVYPELLQLAKRLSDKWDPTVSNESDPGVVLIKELALITDKINYLADKYALENNPRSVTQIENARQLYNLLGYYPEWYESAIVELSMYWSGEKQKTNVTIPKYTSIQDNEGEFVYTTLQDISLPLDGKYASGTVEAIEGTLNKMIVNNSDIITLSMLSDDQRLYIENYNVATNGIFVTDTTGFVKWKQVSNINFVNTGNEGEKRSYSFGVDIVTGQCYLQFPRNITALIGDGLRIYYITSKGKDGNIPVNYLTKFVSSTIESTDTSGEAVSINTADIVITNTSNTYRGKDPIGIDDMYKTWRHIAGTFDTLVTLRDYNNAIRRLPDLASNGFVCDRTNDVQLSYKVMKGTKEMPTTKIKIEHEFTGDDILTDAHEKLLAGEYDSAYDLDHDGEYTEADYIKLQAAITHSDGENDLLWDQDGIPKSMTPYDLKLYCLQAFPYDDIDNYTDYDSTFALFSDYDDERFDELWKDAKNFIVNNDRTKKMVEALLTYYCISHNYRLPRPNRICLLKNKYNVDMQILPNQDLTAIQALEMKSNICKALYTTYQARNVEFGEKIDYDEMLEVIKNADGRVKTVILNRLSYDTYAVFYRYTGGASGGDDINPTGGLTWYEVPVSDEAYKRFVETNGDSEFVRYERNGVKTYYDQWKIDYDRQIALEAADKFRAEILAKNILAGITPFLIDVGGGYPYSFDQYTELDTYADYVRTNMFIPITLTATHPKYSITLQKNEIIEFSSPNLLDLREYGAFIYYEYIGSKVTKNTSHTLQSGEKICFFYKEADDDQLYRFDLYSKGAIIKPSFDLEENVGSNSFISKVFGNSVPTNNECIFNYYPVINTKSCDSLSTDDSVMIQRVNRIRIPEEKQAEGYVYFVTNKIEQNKYALEFDTNKKHVLQENEFFIHTNSSKTSLEIVGQGAEIKWVGTDECETLYVDYVPSSDIAMTGSQAITNKWLALTQGNALYMIEKSFRRATEGSTVTFEVGTLVEGQELHIVITSEGMHVDEYWKKNELIYTDPQGTDESDTCVLVKDDHNNIQENMIFFLGLPGIYKYPIQSGIATPEGGELTKFDGVKLRAYDGQSSLPDEYNADLFAWKCLCYDNNYRYIYDKRTYEQLFCTDGEFDALKVEIYKALLGFEADLNHASILPLVSISDPNPSSTGEGTAPTIPEGYEPTALELEAFVTWYEVYQQDPTHSYSYMENYIKYATNASSIEGAKIKLRWEYSPATDLPPLTLFSEIEIDGEAVPISATEDVFTECRALLNIDVGPDNPQVLRADDLYEGNTDEFKVGVDNLAVDQMWFYLGGQLSEDITGSLNANLKTAKNYILYANKNVFGQGQPDPIDVRYLNEYLEYESPNFYSYTTVKSAKVDGVQRFTKLGKVYYINFGKEPQELSDTGSENPSLFTTNPRLPAGKYIFRLSHSNESLETLYLFHANAKIKILGGGTNIAEPGTYYMTFTCTPDNENTNLDVHSIRVGYKLKNSESVTLAQLKATDYKYGDVYRLSANVTADPDNGLKNDIVAGQYVRAKKDKSPKGFSWWDWSEGMDFPLLSLELSPLIRYELALNYTDQNQKQDYYGYIQYYDESSGTYKNKITSTMLTQKLSELDYDKEFNYLYQIPEQKLIKNPLKSENFFNINHFYNQFTIAESKKPEILV